MKLAVTLDYSKGYRLAAGVLAQCERAGLDIVMVPEVYGFDAVSALGYLAARTDQLLLMSAVLPIYSRTPALIAQSAAGLDELSGGRFLLGLGVSGPQVIEGWHGVPYDAPLRRTREVVEICRLVWRRELLTYKGRCYELPLSPAAGGSGLGQRLKLITKPERPDIPVYIAALGEQNVALAAEIADGWLPIFFLPEPAKQHWTEPLRRGSEARPLGAAPLEIVAGGIAALGGDILQGREIARRELALYIGGMGARGKNFYNDLAVGYGFAEPARIVQDLFLAGERDAAAAAVPDVVSGTSLCGDDGFVRERIAALAESGVTVLAVRPVGDVVRVVERLAEWCH